MCSASPNLGVALGWGRAGILLSEVGLPTSPSLCPSRSPRSAPAPPLVPLPPLSLTPLLVGSGGWQRPRVPALSSRDC